MSRLIDADALLELYDGCEGLHVPVEVVIQNVKDMPTVAEPVRHGRWEDVYDISHGVKYKLNRIHECSVCHDQFEFVSSKYRYCPHCGAKMDGKETE